MRSTLLLAALGLGVLATGSAVAADMPEMMADDQAMSFASDWDGLYVGAGINYISDTAAPDAYANVAGIVGFNKSMDTFLFGAEGYLAYEREVGDPTNAFWIAGGEVRAGVLVSDSVLLYGAVGAEADVTNSDYFGTLGAGVELAVADQVSVDLEYKRITEFGGGFTGNQIGISVLWHM